MTNDDDRRALAVSQLAQRLGIPEDDLAERLDSAAREGRLDGHPEIFEKAADATLLAADATSDPALAAEFRQLSRSLQGRTAEMRKALDELRDAREEG